MPTHALLTPKDAAARLKMSVTAVYSLCEAGLLPHSRIGVKRGRIRIAEVDLDAYLEQARVAPPVTLKMPRLTPLSKTSGGFSLLREAGFTG